MLHSTLGIDNTTMESSSGAFVPRSLPRNCASCSICTLFKAVVVIVVVASWSVGFIFLVGVRGWRWRDVFPYRGAPLFNAVIDCRKVNAGSQLPCGGPWAAPCFSRDRCMGPNGFQRMSVYVHDNSCSGTRSSDIVPQFLPSVKRPKPNNWVTIADVARQMAEKKGILVQTPEEACVIVYAVSTENECASSTPNWQDGKNHLLFDLNDQTRDKRRSLHGKAMFAQSNMRPCYFRHGHDIALPLAPLVTFEYMRHIEPRERKYFATFKVSHIMQEGSLYLSGDGMVEREVVYNLGVNANSTDVVVVEHCQTRHKEHLMVKNVDRCERMEREYVGVEYADIMNTTFALLPAGRSPATYRLGEALSAGAIPVFIHDNFIKPFPDRIPWRRCSFTFSPEDATGIIDTLRSVPHEQLLEMQETALQVFDQYFSAGSDDIVHTTFDMLDERLDFLHEDIL